MAKRRRLTPAQPDYLEAPVANAGPPRLAGIGAPPPIAQVVGEASALAALREVSGALDAARAEGRLLLRLPLSAIESDYLVRDRLVADEEELGHLVSSIAEYGQRSPIEVSDLGGGRYGLISGWRRLTALGRLAAQDEARFGTVLAQIRNPATSASAYVAMVEENEVRSGLSYYERARVAAKAVEAGAFPTTKAALQQLFAAASRARRSKIGSFLTIYRKLDGALRFPEALPERLGLALAQVIEADPEAAGRVASALAKEAASASDEQAALARIVADEAGRNAPFLAILETDLDPKLPEKAGSQSRPTPVAARSPPEFRELRPGLFIRLTGARDTPRLELTGPALDPALRSALEAWLSIGQ